MAYTTVKTIPWVMIAYPSTAKNIAASGVGLANLAKTIGGSNVLSSNIIPEQITFNKPINYSQKAIPGGRTSIPEFNNFGATTVSFTVTHVNVNSEFGVVGVQKFFESLRQPEERYDSGTSALGTLVGNSPPFIANPKVIYFYGTGSVPMVYFVTKVDFTLGRFNRNSFPQAITVGIDLVLDENGALYNAESAFRLSVNKLNLLNIAVQGRTRKSSRKSPYFAESGLIPGGSRLIGT